MYKLKRFYYVFSKIFNSKTSTSAPKEHMTAFQTSHSVWTMLAHTAVPATMSTLEMEKQPAGYSLKASLIILLPNVLIDEIELAVRMVSDAPLQSCLI